MRRRDGCMHAWHPRRNHCRSEDIRGFGVSRPAELRWVVRDSSFELRASKESRPAVDGRRNVPVTAVIKCPPVRVSLS